MKKNLFLLLSVYCFVVQPIAIGVLWGDINFYYLAGINVILIGIISGLYFSAHKTTPAAKTIAEVKTDAEKSSVHIPSTVITSVAKTKAKAKTPVKSKSKKKTMNKLRSVLGWILVFVTCLWIGVTTLYLDQMFSLELSLFYALFSGYLWFWILCSIFSVKTKNMFFRIYRYVLLVGTLLVGGILLYTDFQSPNSYIKDLYNQTSNYIEDRFGTKEDKDNEYATGTVLDVVINSGSISSGSTEDIGSGSVVSGENLNDVDSDESQENLPSDMQTEEKILDTIDENQALTMIQAISYLIDKYDIKLNTKQNIKFKHLPYSDERYPYFKTAYVKKLIGKNTDPDALISCDIYMVMKGLLEEWNVGSYSDIKQAYRNMGKKLDKINGCDQGLDLTIENL